MGVDIDISITTRTEQPSEGIVGFLERHHIRMKPATSTDGFSFWSGTYPETDQFPRIPIWLHSEPESKLSHPEIRSKSWRINTELKYGYLAIVEATLSILGLYLYLFEDSDGSTAALSVDGEPYLRLLADYPSRRFLEITDARSNEPRSKFQIRQRIAEALDIW